MMGRHVMGTVSQRGMTTVTGERDGKGGRKPVSFAWASKNSNWKIWLQGLPSPNLKSSVLAQHNLLRFSGVFTGKHSHKLDGARIRNCGLEWEYKRGDKTWQARRTKKISPALGGLWGWMELRLTPHPGRRRTSSWRTGNPISCGWAKFANAGRG